MPVWLDACPLPPGDRRNGIARARALRADLLATSVRATHGAGHPGGDPGDWTVAAAAPGRRPEPAAPGAPVRRVNLTHTDGLALAVVTDGAACGVDAEPLDRVIDPTRVMRRVSSPAEVARLGALWDAGEVDAAREQFLVAWVVKEACTKAVGTGLTVPLHAIDVDAGTVPKTGSIDVVVGFGPCVGDVEAFSQLNVVVWRPARRHVAALALDSRIQESPEYPRLDDIGP